MKKFFLLIVIIALAATGGMFYWLNQPKFMTGKRENVTKMIITYGIGEEGETYVITEKNEMKEIWDILAKTKDLEINKYPQHAESVQWDPQFRIIIEYSNGAQQMYASTEVYGRVFRFLKSKGGTGDPGYMVGDNEELWQYISALRVDKGTVRDH